MMFAAGFSIHRHRVFRSWLCISSCNGLLRLARQCLLGFMGCLALCTGALATAAEAQHETAQHKAAQETVVADSGAAKAIAIRHNPFAIPDAIRAVRDPQPAQSGIDLSGGLKLRAILFSLSNPLANLNGKILAVGEEIQGYTLAKVFETHVQLIKNEKTYELRLTEDSAGQHG